MVKAAMTPRERVLTAMRRQQPDRVPKRLEYGSFVPKTMDIFRKKTGASNPEEYFNYDARNVHFKPPAQKGGFEKYIPAVIPEGAFVDWNTGNVQKKGFHDNIYVTLHYALEEAETPEEIEAYPMPDFEPYRWEHLKETVSELHARNLAVCGATGGVFEAAWGIRGFNNFLADFTVNPEMIAVLTERLCERSCKSARILAQANVDILKIGDDVGTERGMMISPEMFKKWIKPKHKRIIDAAREIKPDILAFFHSDGDCREIIPDLIDAGFNILNPVQPECMDPAELKLQYGDKLAFWGTIGTQTTMPFGTTADVKNEVKLRVDTVGAGGGLFLSPTHMLQTEVPWENIIAFFEAVDEYGVYK